MNNTILAEPIPVYRIRRAVEELKASVRKLYALLLNLKFNHRQTILTVSEFLRNFRPREVMKFTGSVIPYIYCNMQRPVHFEWSPEMSHKSYSFYLMTPKMHQNIAR